MYVDLSNMHSGFCDRLRQLTFCIAYEQLKKKKLTLLRFMKKKTKNVHFIFLNL